MLLFMSKTHSELTLTHPEQPRIALAVLQLLLAHRGLQSAEPNQPTLAESIPGLAATAVTAARVLCGP
jgi:hypothetical protein